MPFIIVFNIIVIVITAGVLLTIIGCAIASKDNEKRKGESAEKTRNIIDKVRAISYLVFLCLVVLMVIVNIIF